MFTPILPWTDAYPPAIALDWPMPTLLPLIIAVACAVAVAGLAWKLLRNFESAPRKRQGARIHALDRVA